MTISRQNRGMKVRIVAKRRKVRFVHFYQGNVELMKHPISIQMDNDLQNMKLSKQLYNCNEYNCNVARVATLSISFT